MLFIVLSRPVRQCHLLNIFSQSGTLLVSFNIYTYFYISNFGFTLVDGGHRAIMFNRIGGVQNYVLAEGLHFRFFV